MNSAGKRIIQKTLAIAIILIMTMADLCFVGASFVSYAVDIAETSNKNVEFKTYFSNGSESLETTATTDKKDLKVVIELGVKKDGYLSNAKVELDENSSFKFKTDTKSEYISKIDEKSITFKQLNEGDIVKVEAGIEFSNKQEFDADYLSRVSTMNLSGTYVNSKNSNTQITGKSELKINWISPEDIKSTLSSELLTNSVYSEDETNKRVVQVLISSKVENNSYPVKNTNIEVNIPGEPETVVVHKRTTAATNGDKEFNANNYSYADGKLTINVQNGTDNKISWSKNVNDVFVVTAKYPETSEITNLKITTNATVTTYDDKALTQSKEINIVDNKESLVSISEIEAQKEMAKGKIYAGENKDYNTSSEVYVDYANALQKIEIEEQEVKADDEKEIPVNYKNIKFNKSNVSSILGETWTISVTDQANNSKTITNESVTDENGNIIIELEDNTRVLNIETSKPINNGVLRYEITKTIVKTNYSRNEIKELTSIKDSNKVTYTKNDQTTKKSESSATINLKETESKASLNVEPLTLTTLAEQEMQITAVLETNDENRDLYKNPEVKIKLPKQINKISAECSLMHGNGLKLEKGNFKINEENGQEVITIKLTGEQKDYKDDSPTLMITAKVELSKFSTNSSENITMNYTNENATKYVDNGEEKVNINIVSENPMILTNNIEEYNVTSLGKENDKEVTLESNAAAKTAKVKMQIVNNEESSVSNVAILGKIANIDGKIERTSKVRTNKENAKVYYTSVDNPTTSISKSENNWKEESSKDAKFFMVVISSIENAEKINLSYDINIGEKLPYNLTTEAYYKVSYTNTLTNTKKEAESTKLILTTGKVAELKAKLNAKVQGTEIKQGDEVKAGEIIEYTYTISNEGKENANNVKITASIPENTKLVEVNSKYPDFDETKEEYTDKEPYFVEKTETQLVKENLTIEAGKSITLTYMAKVNSINESKTVETTVASEMNENKLEEKFSNKISPAELEVTAVPIYREPNSILDTGYNYIYEVYVTNLTDKEQKNVPVTLNINDGLNINSIYWNIDEDNFGEIENNNKSFTLDRVPANGKVTIIINATAKNNNYNIAEVSATVKNQYKSNKLAEKIKGVQLEVSSTTNSTAEAQKTGYVKIGDKITYTIKIKNTGSVDATQLVIKDEFSDYLNLSKITLNGKECEYEEETVIQEDTSYSILEIDTSLVAGKETTLVIEGTVDENLLGKEKIEIANKATIYSESFVVAEVEQTKYTVIGEKQDDEEEQSEEQSGDNKGNNSQEGKNNTENNTENNNLYTISGTVWKDSNNNGSRDSDEELLSGIKVYALNVETNKLATNNNQEITATTGNEGNYTLTNLEKGKYIVVFEYDTEKYMVTAYQAKGVDSTKNSDAVKASRTVNGEDKLAAYTDSINLTNNISNIDLGLAEAKVFSLKLEKVISKMIVTNKNGSKTYDFEDTDMAKVEIAPKELSGSNVVIEYKLKVTNVGEVAGYAKTIVDYLPSSLTFNSGLNSNWYKKGKNLYTSSLGNTKIEPGETKEVTLTLTKKMTESNTGLTNNKAEIESAYNSLGIQNTTTTEKNGKTSNAGSADSIISVKTGTAVSYVALTLTIIIAICGLAYLVNKKLLMDKIEI